MFHEKALNFNFSIFKLFYLGNGRGMCKLKIKTLKKSAPFYCPPMKLREDTTLVPLPLLVTSGGHHWRPVPNLFTSGHPLILTSGGVYGWP